MSLPDIGMRPVASRRMVFAVGLIALAFIVPAAAWASKPPGTPSGTVSVQLLAFNDLHGNIEPPTGSSGRIGATNAGGVVYLDTHLQNLAATNPNTLIMSAGDNVGASPLISAAFHDEPTIESMNLMGVSLSSVGNHEFDEGLSELFRLQNGGCHPTDGCQDGDGFAGAAFDYLAANVAYHSNGKTVLPAYKIRSVGSAKIGIIGLTLEGTPTIVNPSGIVGLDFLDEADTINHYAEILKLKGVHTIVVLIHEGGVQNVPSSEATINTCNNFAGPIVPIVEALDSDVDVVISAHSHQVYNCVIDGIPVTSASSFGRIITDVDLTINRATDQPTSITATNHIVTRDVTPDPDQQTLVDKYRTAIAPIANRVVGSITTDITKTTNVAGESALGDVIADAQLEYSQSAGAQIAFMNPGGIRADLIYNNNAGGEQPGEITYGEAFTVQPFNNLVDTETLTGAQIKDVLEQQFAGYLGQLSTKFLQVSYGFTYSYDTTQPLGSRTSNIMLNGVPLDPAASYRVTMNSFLADGGDGFTVFGYGTNRVIQPGFDIDALVNYFDPPFPLAPPPVNRITKLA